MAETRQPWWGPTLLTRAKDNAILASADLAWEVRKVPLWVKAKSGYIEVPNNYALVAQHSVLGVVGDRYEPRQNGDLLRWVRGFGGRIVGAWQMREGGVVVGFTVDAQGLDAADVGAGYLHVLNHHSGGGIEVHPAFEDEDLVSFVCPPVHVRSLNEPHEKVNDAVVRTVDSLLPDIRRMQKRGAVPRTISALYEALWPRPGGSAGQKAQSRWKNRKDEIWEVWSASNDSSEWGAFMALLDWAQWHRNFRGSAGDEEANDGLRGEEILFGPTRDISDRAFKYLRGKR